MNASTRITHIGGGWYDIRVSGHTGSIAQGKANAIAKAEELEQKPATIKTTGEDVYARFIQK